MNNNFEVIKYCPKCHKILPIQTHKCPICNNLNLLKFCPKCKKILSDNLMICPICTNKETDEYKQQKTRNKKLTIIICILVCIILSAISAIKFFPIFVDHFYNNQSESSIIQELDGYDKIAFEAIITNIHIFKDTSSVRLVSGNV